MTSTRTRGTHGRAGSAAISNKIHNDHGQCRVVEAARAFGRIRVAQEDRAVHRPNEEKQVDDGNGEEAEVQRTERLDGGGANFGFELHAVHGRWVVVPDEVREALKQRCGDKAHQKREVTEAKFDGAVHAGARQAVRGSRSTAHAGAKDAGKPAVLA